MGNCEFWVRGREGRGGLEEGVGRCASRVDGRGMPRRVCAGARLPAVEREQHAERRLVVHVHAPEAPHEEGRAALRAAVAREPRLP